ncbi:MAG: hypothetical protein AAF675_12465 [Pseudomonadota bacterium]
MQETPPPRLSEADLLALDRAHLRERLIRDALAGMVPLGVSVEAWLDRLSEVPR